MSTGGLAVVLGSTPNRFPGLSTIGAIVFVLDLVLFSLFTVAIAYRFFCKPHTFLASLHHPVESLFFGAYWVSIALILSNIQTYGVPNVGNWLARALEVLFWIYCAVVLVVAVFQYYLLFQEERLKVTDAMPAWVFPIYPLLVTGPMAGQILKSQGPGSAYPIWIGAVMLQGLGWSIAFTIYTLYTLRLMTGSLPSPPMRPGMYVSVGPAGYTAAALISLGIQAPNAVPTNLYNIPSLSAPDVIKAFAITAGIFLTLFSAFHCAISTVAVLAGVRRMSFTLTWWGFVFPNAGLTLAVIQISDALQSPGWNGVASGMTIVLVMAWIGTAFAHIRAVVRKEILWPGKDEDKGIEQVKLWGRFQD